jgi:hypothetical protein
MRAKIPHGGSRPMKHKSIAEVTDDDAVEGGACPFCGFHTYNFPWYNPKVTTCLQCKKTLAICQKCGAITRTETWPFLLGVICPACSKSMDREQAKAFFHVAGNAGYVELDGSQGYGYEHLSYND